MNILKNSFFNAAGYIIPGLLSIPILGYMSRLMGVEIFGIFTITMAIVGYASIFDIGITRAVIREIAIYSDKNNEIIKILSTSTIVVVILGFISAILIYVFKDNITNFLKITSTLEHDFKISLDILSLSIPLYLVTQVWCSLLEGKQNFYKLNIYKTITSTLVVVLPAAFLAYNNSLAIAVFGLFLARIIALILIFLFCKNEIMFFRFKFHQDVFKRLMTFGGWIAVSNIVSPLLSYCDRFIISNKMGSGNVAFYTAPSEAVARIGMLPGAIARVIFPLLSKKDSNSKEVKKYSYQLICITMLPIGLVFCFFSKPIMAVWFGNIYGINSSDIFIILMVGLFLNSLAQVPFASIQAKGMSKVTAMIHLFELIPYLYLLYYLINHYGLIGAAWAWTLRMLVDLIALTIIDKIEFQNE